MIINGLCFLAHVVLKGRGLYDLNMHLGLYYPESTYFRPFQIITNVFMHADFMHLFFNMFGLWMFGSKLENYWGPKRFFIFYFVTAFGASALHMGVNAIEIFQFKQTAAAFFTNANYESFFQIIQSDNRLANSSEMADFLINWKEDLPNTSAYLSEAKRIVELMLQAKLNGVIIGASGAVYGLLLGFGMLFPNTEIIMLFFPFPIKAKYFVVIFGLIELYEGIQNNPTDNVAHFAHLGGMLFGFVLIKIWNKTNRNQFY
jgi:membrane associated rhomboid family serine protease